MNPLTNKFVVLRSVSRYAVIVVTLSVFGQAAASETTAIFDGVQYGSMVRSEPRPLRIHFVQVDAKAAGIDFLVTPPNPERKSGMDEVILKTTSAFAREHKLQVAINGTFFMRGPDARDTGDPVGVNFTAVHDGTAYSRPAIKNEVMFRWVPKSGMELWVADGDAPWQFKPGDGQMALGMARWAQLLRDGKVIAGAGKDHHPRTAIGVSKDKSRIFLVVVDGRQWGISEGMSLAELAELLKELGAHSAINLDGGGSTTMVIQQGDGSYRIANRPSDYFPLSVERPCGTHLGLFARPLNTNTGEQE